MISKLIYKAEEKELLTFDECLENTGIYKRHLVDHETSENLVVIYTAPYPNYFGIYNNGTVFPHVSDRGFPDSEYYKIGDIELIVKVLEARND